MTREYQLYYSGAWRRGHSVQNVLNPSNGEVAARCNIGQKEHLDDAIDGAVRAFEEMKNLSSFERSQILAEVARGIEEAKEDFTNVLVEEAGKPALLARVEVERAIQTVKLGAEEAMRIEGKFLPLDLTRQSKTAFGVMRRFPIGVIGAIAPFNYPLNLVVHKVAPAIAAGNSIVLKPASQTPGGAILLAGLFAATALPKGAFAVVPTPGKVAEQMAEDARIAMLTFTGSADIGWMLKKKAWKKRVTLELGGNAAVIVHYDANLDRAVPQIATSGYLYAGQVCISTQRILVNTRIYDTFRDRYIEAVKKVPFGDPRDESTIVGPMINESAAKQTETWVEDARKNGARVLLGGKRNGTFYEPTVLENVPKENPLWAEEAFAPITVLQPYERFEEAIAVANDTRYGLQAGVFTQDIDRIKQAFLELEVGGVIINNPPIFRVDAMPYGGVKDSGIGREGVRYAIEEMTEPKLMVLI